MRTIKLLVIFLSLGSLTLLAIDIWREDSGFWSGFFTGALIATTAFLISIEISRFLVGRQEPDLPESGSERIQKKEVASVVWNAQVIRGKLFLTNQALRFRAKSRSRNPLVIDIPLRDMESVERFNHRGMFPFGLEIKTVAGERFGFLFEDRDDWQKALKPAV